MDSIITLYSNDCPKCKVLEDKLNSKGIKFYKNTDIAQLASFGLRSLPVLKIEKDEGKNGTEPRYLTFVEANEWVNKQLNLKVSSDNTEIQEAI